MDKALIQEGLRESNEERVLGASVRRKVIKKLQPLEFSMYDPSVDAPEHRVVTHVKVVYMPNERGDRGALVVFQVPVTLELREQLGDIPETVIDPSKTGRKVYAVIIDKEVVGKLTEEIDGEYGKQQFFEPAYGVILEQEGPYAREISPLIQVVGKLKENLPQGILDVSFILHPASVRVDSTDNEALDPFLQDLEANLNEAGLKLGEHIRYDFTEDEQADGWYIQAA